MPDTPYIRPLCRELTTGTMKRMLRVLRSTSASATALCFSVGLPVAMPRAGRHHQCRCGARSDRTRRGGGDGRAPRGERADRADQHHGHLECDDREIRRCKTSRTTPRTSPIFRSAWPWAAAAARRRASRRHPHRRLHPRHLGTQHHGVLHRRYAAARFAGSAHTRHRTHRGAARAAGNVVRRIVHGRHGAHHHAAGGFEHLQRHGGCAGLRHVARRRSGW